MPRPNTEQIFHEARTIQSPEEREGYLRGVCGDDLGLRSKVEALLRADAAAASFLGEGSEALTATATYPAGVLERAGQMIGRYKLLQKIGEGGFGSVWMAEQVQPVRRLVALKIIKLGMDTRQVIARFEAERQALAMMDHPNISRVLDAGATESGRPYFVMELVKGEPITRYCDLNNLSIPERLELFAQVCQAVQHAHTKGVIHRDVKPSNVLVSTQDGRPFAKVIDFGIAKATVSRLTEKTLFTEHRQLIGTLEYMAPEQAEGSLDIDTRADVYSLGVLLYELLTGLTPFDPKWLRSAAFGEIQRIIREVEPELPSTRLSHATDALPSVAAHRHTDPRSLCRLVRGELDWIVMKCLEKDRGRRYETANAVAEDVRRYLSGQPVEVGPPRKLHRAVKLVRRHKGAFAAGAMVATALVLGLAAAMYGLVVARAERDAKAQALGMAQRSQQQSEMVQGFLSEIIAASAPDRSLGESVTVKEVMQLAARRAEELKDDAARGALRHQLGMVLADLNQLEEARGQFTQALAVRRRLPSADDRASTMLALGRVNRQLQMPGYGEEQTRDARAILVERHGEESLAVVRADIDVAATLARQGRRREASTVASSALRLVERLDPQVEHAAVHAALLEFRADAHWQEEELERAAEDLERAVAIQRRRPPAASMRLANSLATLGEVLTDLGRLEEAERCARESLAMRQQILPEAHPHLGHSYMLFGRIARSRGEMEEAQRWLRDAVAMYQQTLGVAHRHVAAVKLVLATVLAEREPPHLEESAAQARQAVAIYQAQANRDDGELADAQSRLGEIMGWLGHHDEAEVLLLQAYQVLSRAPHLQPETIRTVEALVLLYESMKSEKAEVFRARLEELRDSGGK